jgi:hypothetical protein
MQTPIYYLGPGLVSFTVVSDADPTHPMTVTLRGTVIVENETETQIAWSSKDAWGGVGAYKTHSQLVVRVIPAIDGQYGEVTIGGQPT